MRHAMTAVGIAVGTVAAWAPGAAPAAQAVASPVSPAFGNTVVSTYPDGRKAELWLRADGGYSGQGRRHDPSSGHWKVKADKLCLRQSRPIPIPFSYCFPLPATGFDSAWSGKAPTGEPTRISVVRGHVGGG